MNPPYDPITLIGGGSLFGGLVVAFTLLVRRLTAQDTGWQAIVEELRNDLKTTRDELKATRAELAEARLQISELQRWGVERDP